MTNNVEKDVTQQKPDYKSLFIKERYERLQIEATSLQKRFAEIQREIGDIEKMMKAKEEAEQKEADDRVPDDRAKETPVNEL